MLRGRAPARECCPPWSDRRGSIISDQGSRSSILDPTMGAAPLEADGQVEIADLIKLDRTRLRLPYNQKNVASPLFQPLAAGLATSFASSARGRSDSLSSSTDSAALVTAACRRWYWPAVGPGQSAQISNLEGLELIRRDLQTQQMDRDPDDVIRNRHPLRFRDADKYSGFAPEMSCHGSFPSHLSTTPRTLPAQHCIHLTT